MHTIILNTRKFLANSVSALFFFDRQLRHSVRECLHPYSPSKCVSSLKSVVSSNEHVSTIPLKHFDDSRIIWQCWFQGPDNRPEAVKMCMDTVQRYIPQDYMYVCITAENFREYLSLPDYIVKKWNDGIICDAHFSDIIRLYLLSAYGGVWIDATCMLTSGIPENILNASFFCYRSQGEFAFTYIQNCFMKAEPSDFVCHKMYSSVCCYWRQYDYPIHYFVFHLMFKALLEVDEDFSRAYHSAGCVEDDSAMHYMFYALNRGAVFSDNLVKKSSEISFIHKLTYKNKNMFSNGRPKVTLIVSSYNWPEALRLSLESAARQTVLPLEVVIADDGSRDDVRAVADEIGKKFPELDIVYVWHPDDGFRKTIILNKAIAQAKGEYIIQTDGDVVLEKHFIEDHIELMEPGYYVCGSRTKLDEPTTKRIIKSGVFKADISGFKLSFVLNSLRSRILRKFLALRYARKIDHMRGCNMAFWRSDAIMVNGYNEDLLQWGHEDGEFVYRLHNAGVKKKSLKMGGVVYHLWHKESSRSNEQFHLNVLDKVISEKISWCANGIDKYLKK